MEVNIHEAKTHFSRLVQRALAGEDVVIAKAGKPLVRLVPVQDNCAVRQFGLDKGKFMVPDDFDAQDQDILNLFQT